MFPPADPSVAAVLTHLAHVGLGPGAAQVPGPVARLAATTPVGLQEDPGNLPGGSALQTLINGVAGWALILSLAGLVVGAAAWALGAHSQNYHQSYIGRRTVLVSGLASLLIGAAPGLINFFFHTGQTIH
jgi:hypothetical protein